MKRKREATPHAQSFRGHDHDALSSRHARAVPRRGILNSIFNIHTPKFHVGPPSSLLCRPVDVTNAEGCRTPKKFSGKNFQKSGNKSRGQTTGVNMPPAPTSRVRRGAISRRRTRARAKKNRGGEWNFTAPERFLTTVARQKNSFRRAEANRKNRTTAKDRPQTLMESPGTTTGRFDMRSIIISTTWKEDVLLIITAEPLAGSVPAGSDLASPRNGNIIFNGRSTS